MINPKRRSAENEDPKIEKKKFKKSPKDEKSKILNKSIESDKKIKNVTEKKSLLKKKSHTGSERNSNKSKPKTENMKPEDWSEFKKQKKELRMVRKKKKNIDIYEICIQAKKISENLRRKNLEGGEGERNNLCEKLHTLLKNESDKSNYSKLVLAHDMTRVVQVMLKYSKPKIKEEILNDLLSCIVPMLQSSYGRFCVKKMFKYGSQNIRSRIIENCYGHIVKMTAHNLSNSVIDQAYTTWASGSQKLKLKQEFYGDIYRHNKDDSITTLADTYKNSEHMKNAMLSATKANLLKVMNKQLFDNSLFHAVLFEFLTECSAEDRAEFVSQLCTHVATMCCTKEGVKCGMICLWQATNKEKKMILRNIKEHAITLAQHEHGHIFLLAVLSAVDDTVLLNKMLVNDLIFQANDLVQNEWGRRVLLWLVAPEDKTYFHPELINELREGVKTSSCKKSAEIRAQEILANCRDPLCEAIHQNCSDWLKSASVAIVTVAILKAGTGESLRNALNSVAQVIVSSNWIVKDQSSNKKKLNKQNKTEVISEELISGIEHSGLHMVLKKLAQFDKIQVENNNATFGEAVATYLKKKVLKHWLTLNRPSFLVLTIIENCDKNTKQSLIEMLRMSSIKEVLEKQTHVGAQLLRKAIEE